MMSGQFTHSHWLIARTFARCLMVSAVLLCLSQPAMAQFGFGFGVRGGVVGGVSVDADGTVRTATALEQQGWLKQMQETVSVAKNTDLGEKTDLRMISLVKLQKAIANAMEKDVPLSDEVLYLAGLQRVEYIFVLPEQNDIVIAGPAEGWELRSDASVVGVTTGLPVIHLEDLLTALRSVTETQKQPMSVSIDPTAEGQQRLSRLLSQVRPGTDPRQLEPAMQKAFGAQVVSLKAVPKDSRMASALVAADYRMKRLAMALEEAPVRGLPSYMQMIRNGGLQAGTQPRWWMAPNYDAILHSEDRLAWKLTGQGIKAMTESEIVDLRTGERKQTGRANRQAQKWADLFTERFDELCAHNAAFGDVRNVMDLNIIATVIAGHQLEEVAGCDLGLLFGETGDLETPSWKTPASLSPQCSFVRGTSGWTVSASGGVEINSWRVVSERSKASDAVATLRSQASADSEHWWWN